ncbi:MAG: NAAT family transporter [Candidatus Neomarinimicrobiota bacterium]|jgi:multiple antibiotic resistance protein|nr:NAAT family transporter [Candidatus Neomarinimicrobiota bacterium]MEC7871824.1 NAAT family transporter [Candidatus Neomarinimicrobiota bacterium]MEC9437087.1 NAAT family transporter [Candidatus Neomarinimicrobiota bacterium]MEC9474805.1 NAAT family transporter [Candidatus Neomarinimicrobiota bacterium]|tara:strand:- start:413 stop:1057 length:645 start_codon:yes stop_codon:yes gene_type:complete
MIDYLNIELQYLLFCLSTLFTVVNPLGITPIFAAMTEKFSNEDQIRIARKGIITGLVVLIIFTLLGSFIFQFYGITVEAFQIMGGIIFFRSGLRMLDAQVGRSRTTQSERDEFKDSDELAISPIGVPLITGPGAITGVVILSGKGPTDYSIVSLLISVLITMGLFYWILRAGNLLAKKIGITGMRVIERMMGLILMVIAVQFIINGLETIINRI